MRKNNMPEKPDNVNTSWLLELTDEQIYNAFETTLKSLKMNYLTQRIRELLNLIYALRDEANEDTQRAKELLEKFKRN